MRVSKSHLMANLLRSFFQPRKALARFAGLISLMVPLEGQTTAGASLPAAQPLIQSSMLAEKSGPREKTMFRIMSAEETGIKTENNYADPEMWGAHYLEYATGGIGCGIAIGDYDGDGKPDIFVVSKTESCRLFRNLGGWKFEDVTKKAGVGDEGAAAMIWKQGATFVDINNDGLLDIYVCRFNAPNLLYINQGDGTFKEMAHAYGLDVVDACGTAAFCDYDRDGWLDVYIQTNLLNIGAHPNGQPDYLFHNNRDGTFTNVTAKAGISGESQGHSATWWDYDGDGWPDLYVANDFGIPDKLYHNNRDGTFTDTIAQTLPHTTFASMGSDHGDINNDGWEDLFVADMAATTHEKDQRTASGVRAGVLDPSASENKLPKYLHNALHINTGTGRFLEGAYLAGIAATDWTWSVRFEDLDNDGWLDLFVTNGMNREQSNIDLIAREMRAETSEERIRIMKDSGLLAEKHLGFKNEGGLRFSDQSKEWGLDQVGVSFGAAFGDLDGDGDLDLVYINFQGGVTVLRNDSQEGHRVLIDLRGEKSNRFGVGAKVTIWTDSGLQTRTLTLARGYMSNSEPVVHFGLGQEKEIKKLQVEWPSGQVQVFENVSVDRRYVIHEPKEDGTTAANAFTKTKKAGAQFKEASEEFGLTFVQSEEAVDETSVQKLLPVRLNRAGPSLAAADLGGTGQMSIVVGGTSIEGTKVLRGSGVGKETHYTKENLLTKVGSGGVNDGPVLLFEANGDGYPDLLVTKGGNSLPDGAPEYQPQLYINDGQGGFRLAPAGLPTLSISVGAAAAADFLHDGRLGLFLGGRVRPGDYPTPAPSVLLANRGGHFEDVTAQLAPEFSDLGLVTSALWTDVDGDGWIDLLVTLEWGTVKYYHNNHGKKFENWSERAGFVAAGSGWWTALAAADFNGDGRLDYVVGNVGLNTQYHASPSHPAVLFSGNFGPDDAPELIEGYFEGDKLYPWRSRRDLGAAIPSILRKYPRTDAYAKATLQEILGAKLTTGVKYTATELRSGVFLSQADGTYRFEPLPHLAQIAPLQGIVAGDFDGDGLADIYTVQNSYAPIPSVGRFDGGLSQFLRGDGHGHFTPVPILESGLKVPGDAKALIVVDLNSDHWPDFVVSRNDQSPLAFVNQPIAGRQYLQVSLKGSLGNPSCIGGSVRVVYKDGTTQTALVSAGAGWASQSPPDAFFGYIHQNPPSKIDVHWPDGSSSSTSVEQPIAAKLVISH